ncbi:hypothetical protein EDD86DRAFT_95079 [Gorgonomyces haynaldii]|nr:hypothetical protein EDD86DRAFT_95079 [Gorgonomyces haynaldii]
MSLLATVSTSTVLGMLSWITNPTLVSIMAMFTLTFSANSKSKLLERLGQLVVGIRTSKTTDEPQGHGISPQDATSSQPRSRGPRG